jgi:nitrous oxide reductase accessory protein NosL
MFPARSPQWAAQIIFNGDAQYFDSPLSLFMYLQDVARYSPGRSGRQIAAHYVTDASAPPDGKRTPWVDALSAYYVSARRPRGPCAPATCQPLQHARRSQCLRRAAWRRGAAGAIDAALVAELASGGGHAISNNLLLKK